MSEVTYPIHPAAMLFPMMSEDELSGLVSDIERNGLLEPILLYQGQILDGRNRLAACESAGVEPRFADTNGSVSSPTSYVLSKNLHRRHLTISQRGAIAAEAVPLFEGEAHKRMVAGTLAPIGARGKATEIIAEKTQVSPRTVERALAVQRKDPAAFERVKAGEITLNQATGEQVGQNKLRQLKANGKPKTDRQIAVAESHKERMVTALSKVIGLCRGLGEELDFEAALHVCTDEERKTWANRARESANKLRKFALRLERGTNAECS